jgi:hypothetical protein
MRLRKAWRYLKLGLTALGTAIAIVLIIGYLQRLVR